MANHLKGTVSTHYCLLSCRRLTPNFKVRVEVSYKTRCSFPLTLKAYVISQQEKDSVPEWVPDDFLDPDLPQVRVNFYWLFAAAVALPCIENSVPLTGA
jgi:hypothetical protein